MADFLKVLVSRYRFLSLAEKQLIYNASSSPDVLKKFKIRDIEAITGRKLGIRSHTIEKIIKEAENARNILASGGINCLFFGEKKYPVQLAEIYNPPYALYFRGRLPECDCPSVAVVGTRIATGEGIDAAFGLGFEFGNRCIPVVSGLALGIDSAAHSGCVSAGGVTIAVLGAGPDRIYPAGNRGLASAILENGGALLSEYLPGEEPQKHHFPERNRLISGLSRGVAVIEAPGKSGALITAEFALEQGRDLYIHKAGLKLGERCERIQKMVFDGAPVINGFDGILSDWGISTEPAKQKHEEKDRLTSVQAGLALAEMLRDELEGKSVKFNGNYFRRACYESSYSINS